MAGVPCPAMEGRRASLRAQLLMKIRAAALDELRTSGAAHLCLRKVAKAAGISPSGLYRYVDGRDGLLELLISDGFESFGQAIGEAIDAAGNDPLDRLEAMALGYRRWARANPEWFGLILGTPVPGFQARVDGPTTASVYRFGEPMVRVVADVHVAGLRSGPNAGAARIDLVNFDSAVVLDAPLKDLLARGWARIHGLVMLETFGHLVWTDANVEELLRTEVRAIMAELGTAADSTR